MYEVSECIASGDPIIHLNPFSTNHYRIDMITLIWNKLQLYIVSTGNFFIWKEDLPVLWLAYPRNRIVRLHKFDSKVQITVCFREKAYSYAILVHLIICK